MWKTTIETDVKAAIGLGVAQLIGFILIKVFSIIPILFYAIACAIISIGCLLFIVCKYKRELGSLRKMVAEYDKQVISIVHTNPSAEEQAENMLENFINNCPNEREFYAMFDQITLTKRSWELIQKAIVKGKILKVIANEPKDGNICQFKKLQDILDKTKRPIRESTRPEIAIGSNGCLRLLAANNEVIFILSKSLNNDDLGIALKNLRDTMISQDFKQRLKTDYMTLVNKEKTFQKIYLRG